MRAQRPAPALADRAPREANHGVRCCAEGMHRAPGRAGGGRFVHGDCTLGSERRQQAPKVFGVKQLAAGHAGHCAGSQDRWQGRA